jgi:hypothetical protein
MSRGWAARYPEAYARGLASRRQATLDARRGRSCTRCGGDISTRVATARYCSVACQKAKAYADRHPPRPRRVAVVEPVVPVPDLDHSPLVDDALAALRPYERAEIGSDFDAIGRDLVGAYVLAAVAGDDPVAAVRRERARYSRDRRWLVFGSSTVTGLER